MVFKKKDKAIKRIEAQPAEESEDFDEEFTEGYEGEGDGDEGLEEPPEDELPPMPVPSQRPRKARPVQRRRERWSVRTVPIQSQTVIYDESEGKAYTIEQAMVKILNSLEEQ